MSDPPPPGPPPGPAGAGPRRPTWLPFVAIAAVAAVAVGAFVLGRGEDSGEGRQTVSQGEVFVESPEPNVVATTPTTPPLGDVSGRWEVSATKASGSERCGAGTYSEPVQLEHDGGRLTMTDLAGDASSSTGTIDPDGRFKIVYSEGGVVETIEGQFVSGTELRASATISVDSVTCVYTWTGRR